VFNANQDDPTTKLLSMPKEPFSKKKGEITWLGSSAKLGSAAPSSPDVLAGPSRPIVAYVSSTKSGKDATKAG
jgi:hypothetical protein